MLEREERKPPAILIPIYKREELRSTLESVQLSGAARLTLSEILKREEQPTPEDVVAMALEVYRLITEHLSSHKDSKVILHTQGESLRTLHIRNTARSHTEGVRTVYKSVQPQKASAIQAVVRRKQGMS